MDSSFSFRKTVCESDMEAVREIVKSTGFFDAVPTEIECAVSDVRDTFELGEEKSGSWYVFLERNGKTIGFASYGGPVECTDRLFYMYWIAVSGGERGRGAGKLLMREVVGDIKAKGARKLVLQTSGRGQYLPTRMFYLACGFRQEAEIADYYQTGDSCCFFGMDFPNHAAKP